MPRRQLAFTPFPTEPLSWMFEQAGADLFLLSSDYPHIEGGRNPLEHFESTLQGVIELLPNLAPGMLSSG